MYTPSRREKHGEGRDDDDKHRRPREAERGGPSSRRRDSFSSAASSSFDDDASADASLSSREARGADATTFRPSSSFAEEETVAATSHATTASRATTESHVVESATTAETKTSIVRFRPGEPEIASLVPPRSELSPSERRRLWWNSRDYSEFKITAKVICREMRQCGGSSGLNSAYGRARHAADFVGSIVEERSEGESADDIEMAVARLRLDKGLVPWCTHGHSRRGLERWGSKSHGQARTNDAESAKAAVVAECRRQLVTRRSRSLRSSPPGSAEDAIPVVARNEDEIGRVAWSSSRTARIFARMMGEADAFAAAAVPAPLHSRSSCSIMRRKSMPDMAILSSDAASLASSAPSQTPAEDEASRESSTREATATQPRRRSDILLPRRTTGAGGSSMRPLSGLVLSTLR